MTNSPRGYRWYRFARWGFAAGGDSRRPKTGDPAEADWRPWGRGPLGNQAPSPGAKRTMNSRVVVRAELCTTRPIEVRRWGSPGGLPPMMGAPSAVSDYRAQHRPVTNR